MCTRSQYIYIGMDEMRAVADYIVKRGRIPISELAAKSATLVDLEPKTAAVASVAGRPVIDFDTLVDN